MSLHDYTCEVCGGEFTGSRSEEDRLEEHERVWGFKAEMEDCALVCSECFPRILAWGKARGLVVGDP